MCVQESKMVGMRVSVRASMHGSVLVRACWYMYGVSDADLLT